jgi:hypothetical protein
MSKPFDEAEKLKGICRFCLINTETISAGTYKYERKFTCSRIDLGVFEDFCTKEDYYRCTFNEVNMKSLPQTSPAGKTALSTGPGKNVDKAPPRVGPGYIDDLKKLTFESREKFYWGCQFYFKKLKKDVDPLLKTYDLTDADDRKMAWARLVDRYAPGMKEA